MELLLIGNDCIWRIWCGFKIYFFLIFWGFFFEIVLYYFWGFVCLLLLFVVSFFIVLVILDGFILLWFGSFSKVVVVGLIKICLNLLFMNIIVWGIIFKIVLKCFLRCLYLCVLICVVSSMGSDCMVLVKMVFVVVGIFDLFIYNLKKMFL